MRYSRYNTENVSKFNNIKIVAQEKETMCAPRCVICLGLLCHAAMIRTFIFMIAEKEIHKL